MVDELFGAPQYVAQLPKDLRLLLSWLLKPNVDVWHARDKCSLARRSAFWGEADALSQVQHCRCWTQSCPPCSSYEQLRKVEDVHLKSKGAVVAYQCGSRRQ